MTTKCSYRFKDSTKYRFFLKFFLYSSNIERYKCSIFEQMRNNQDHFEVLRKIQSSPKASQREMAEDLGFSLGKLNYCLKALQQKGLVKIKSFSKKNNKVRYFQQYILTPKGIAERTKLTINFMKRKMREYDELKKELKDL